MTAPGNAGTILRIVLAFLVLWGGIRSSRRLGALRNGSKGRLMKHPCGNLPVHSVSVAVYYCTYHQAFWAHVGEDVQSSDEFTYDHHSSNEFGPFDSQKDVYDWARRRLEEGMFAPGVPWGSESQLDDLAT